MLLLAMLIAALPPVGGVEDVTPPGLETAIDALRELPHADSEFVLMYYRPDGDYEKWNLWLWGPGGGGERHAFAGVVRGVAFFRAPIARFFPRSDDRLNLIVRTDAWAKDPGPDQSWVIRHGRAFVVLSGQTRVWPVEPPRPRLLGADAIEESPGVFVIRVALSARLRLSEAPGPNGFRIDGGLKIDDAGDFTACEPGSSARDHLTDDVRLSVSGRIIPSRTYAIRHPAFGEAAPGLEAAPPPTRTLALGGAVSIRFPAEPKPAPPLPASARRRLPEPILEANPEWVELYWAAWRFMHEKITRGDPARGFMPLYIDEGFNENIYQWDSCFMAAYALYGRAVFPAMSALDNFYNLQRDTDGYICRTYNEITGRATGENDINPPLFAWIEWRHWRQTGDPSRLARALPVLDRYFQWVKRNARSERGRGLYFITDLGSGMDNSPRESFIRRGAWIDLSAQQALAALSISRLAKVAGDHAMASRYEREFHELRDLINAALWDDVDGNYFDLDENGAPHRRRTIASFWPLLAEVADTTRARRMIDEHLRNPAEFFRPHLFPTLAANDPDYDSRGHYWRGGVWAPTTYAVIQGIALHDPAFAREAAANHIANMADVFQRFRPASYPHPLPPLTEPNIARNGDGRRQIWEAYSPEHAAPGTRWDARFLVRQKFCGWSGLGPVAMLIENVLGFDVDAPANTVTWRVTRRDRHGIRRLLVGDNAVTLVARARPRPGDPLVIAARAEHDLRVVILDGESGERLFDASIRGGKTRTIHAGR
jgi:hypothetical protein